MVIACAELLNIVTRQFRVIAVTLFAQQVVGPIRALGLSLEVVSIVIFSLLKELASFADQAWNAVAANESTLITIANLDSVIFKFDIPNLLNKQEFFLAHPFSVL
jgi:hypothetical protein